MDPKQLDEISNEIESLHRPMKNIIQTVFAISPLLALCTHGWTWKTTNATYLLRVSSILFLFRKLSTITEMFIALGNNRPQVLVNVEDKVLEAIVAVSDGMSPQKVLDVLYSEVFLLEKDLSSDVEAMSWFDLFTDDFSIPTPPPSAFHSTPSKG